MRRRLNPALSLALLGAAASFAGDLSGALPAVGQGGAAADLAALRADFPALLDSGPLAGWLGRLAAKGLPDPATELDQVGVAIRFGGPDGVADAVTLAASRRPALPLVREVAATRGVALRETARRGLRLLRGEFDGRPVEFADLADGRVYAGYSRDGAFALGAALQDTLAGAAESFAQRFQTGLSGGAYLTLRLAIDKATRAQLAEGKLRKLAELAALEVDCGRADGRVVLRATAELTSGLKAMAAAPILRSKLGGLAATLGDPVARKILEAAEITRKRKRLTLRIEADGAGFGRALDALLSAMDAKLQAKAGAAD